MPSTIAAGNRLVAYTESGYETFDVSGLKKGSMIYQKSFLFVPHIKQLLGFLIDI